MKEFPIMKNKGKEYIPYDVIKPHEEQAMKNHGQTLDRLAERGGLGWSEAYAVLTDSKIPFCDEYISDEFYEKKVKEIVSNTKLTEHLKFNGGTSMDFLTNLDSETLKAELLAFLELGDDEFDISSMGEFEEQFVEFIKDDLSYAD